MANSTQAAIIHVLKYFARFQYPPSFNEIYSFLPLKTSRAKLENELEKMTKMVKVIRNDYRYTLPGYSIYFKKYAVRKANAENKLKILYKFTSVAKWIPYIQFFGLSGSISMMNAKSDDDIDICIIMKKDRLWTGRLLTSLIASFLGMRRKRNEKHVSNKICLNLYFDEHDLNIPYDKQTEYVGHETLQMKRIFDRDGTYEKFLKENEWIQKYFPNVKYNANFIANISHSSGFPPIRQLADGPPKSFKMGNFILRISNFIEFICKKIQLYLINKHRTTEIITDTQLWFFPHDYEKKLRRKKTRHSTT